MSELIRCAQFLLMEYVDETPEGPSTDQFLFKRVTNIVENANKDGGVSFEADVEIELKNKPITSALGQPKLQFVSPPTRIPARGVFTYNGSMGVKRWHTIGQFYVNLAKILHDPTKGEDGDIIIPNEPTDFSMMTHPHRQLHKIAGVWNEELLAKIIPYTQETTYSDQK